MPTYLAPHKSGAHRAAAIALYRALISQAGLLPLEEETRTRVAAIVRERFRDARFVTSARQLKLLFTAGYEGIDLLDGAAKGGTWENGRVNALIAQARPPKSQPQPEPSKPVEEKREKIDIFSRPLPKEKLSGKRRVPVLVNAGHIPMLRFTKPQPKALTGYLLSRIRQRQRRHDLRGLLGEAVWLAGEEDRWDGILERQQAGGRGRVERGEGGGSFGENDGVRWTSAVRDALQEVRLRLDEEREKNRVWAERMQGVVDREREMVERERVVEEREKARRKKSSKDSTMGDETAVQR